MSIRNATSLRIASTWLLTLTLVFSTHIGLAQTASPAGAPSANLAGIAHVAIRVRDLDASVAYYEKLGFIKAFALSRDGKVYEAFIKINDQQYLELYPVDDRNTQPGFLHACFYGNNLQSVHDFYVAQGLSPNAVRTAGAGNLLFTMPGPATPTGPQNMEYTQYMPASMHSKAAGQFLGPDRVSSHLIGVEVAFVNPTEAAQFYKTRAGFIPVPPTGTPEPGPRTLFALPGAPSETIKLVSAPSLGFRSRIILASDTTAAASTLTQHNVAFKEASGEMTKGELLLTDPDGNQIILHPER
jgi:catechol 2,3-dioxygenase-like lactoylglutathione lyase family enzyme